MTNSMRIVIFVVLVASVLSEPQICSLVRYKDSVEPIRWGIVEGDQVIALKNSEQYQSTRHLLERGMSEIQSLCEYIRGNSGGRVLQLLDTKEIDILSPITGTHIYASNTHSPTHRSHFSEKSSGTLIGPSILKPTEVKLLDYRLNIGILLGKPIPQKTAFRTLDDVALYVAGFVQINEFSPHFVRNADLPELTVVGRNLVLLNENTFSKYFRSLESEFQVNSLVQFRKSLGEVEDQLIEIFATLSFVEELNVGDVIMIEVSTSKIRSLPIIGSLPDFIHKEEGTPEFFDSLLESLGQFSHVKSGDSISSRIYSSENRQISSGPQDIGIVDDSSLVWKEYQQFVQQNSYPGFKLFLFSLIVVGSIALLFASIVWVLIPTILKSSSSKVKTQ